MPKFDLSQAADFSRLTQGTLGNLAGLLGVRDPREWDIVEASYRGIKFHVFELSNIVGDALQGNFPNPLNKKTRWDAGLSRVTDGGGRRKIKYQFPYRDGQTTDDLGRKPGTFEMEAIIHGPRYMEGYKALLEAFDDPTPAELVHPVRGAFTACVEEVSVLHHHEARKAVEIRVTFIEHNFTVGGFRKAEADTFKSFLAGALMVFRVCDKIINKIEQSQLLGRSLKNLLRSYMEIYKRNNAAALTNMNKSFNKQSGSVDIPSMLPYNLGGTGSSLSLTGGPTEDNALFAAALAASQGNLTDAALAGYVTVNNNAVIVSDQNFVVVRSVSDPFVGIPVEQLTAATQAAIAVEELTKQVESLRRDATAIIQVMEANDQAALELAESVLDLRTTVIQVQLVLEKGIATSSARVVTYVTPRLMSLREVAFANGLAVERVEELDLLNPSLLSVNFISQGTTLKVPTV